VPDQLEVAHPDQMADVAPLATEKIVQAQNFVAVLQQTLA
jgi:hypothetical protein